MDPLRKGVESWDEGRVASCLVGDDRTQGADFPSSAQQAGIISFAFATRRLPEKVDGVAVGGNASQISVGVAAR